MIDLKTAPYAILALRVTTGALFLFHGLVKLFVFTPAGTAGYFESIGLPGTLGYLTMLIEIAGGLALILGIKARIVSLALVPVLLGAAWFGHGASGFNWSNPNGGWEYPMMWAMVQAALAAVGDGANAMLPSKRA
ncbi:DoxX family protein [Fuscibacter oryzae]|uniref:DoxX family protein n=1 Tax=Fuscibacter oryzae TaxID=2803939 RepID=A0A8J7MTQ7_9RHOB|nr:DoxX family protein [Fuscibacter oryzae]MBL4929998.1 DoxX family protein [Fuscibacter oryzae]